MCRACGYFGWDQNESSEFSVSHIYCQDKRSSVPHDGGHVPGGRSRTGVQPPILLLGSLKHLQKWPQEIATYISRFGKPHTTSSHEIPLTEIDRLCEAVCSRMRLFGVVQNRTEKKTSLGCVRFFFIETLPDMKQRYIYRFFNETTRFCGYVFVLSPLVYLSPFCLLSTTTHKRRSACRLREALGVIAVHSILRIAISCSSLKYPFSFLSLSRSGAQAYLV
jgi:hypothetical protein